MLKIVERDWLMNVRGTGYRFDKTNEYKRMKQNNDAKFDNVMKNCNVKIIGNIFSNVNYLYKSIVILLLIFSLYIVRDLFIAFPQLISYNSLRAKRSRLSLETFVFVFSLNP